MSHIIASVVLAVLSVFVRLIIENVKKKKSMRFQIRANQDGKQKGYDGLNENILILFLKAK